MDGVFFQLASSGIARVWESLIPRLSALGLDIIFLDRGGKTDHFEVQRVTFPSYTYPESAADSVLLEGICRELKADVFASTYYTTPLVTPSVVIVHDMIPELFDFNLRERDWTEKALAITYAEMLIAVSENTAKDLRSFYPFIDSKRISIAHCGVDREMFYRRGSQAIAALRERLDLSREFYITVGSRQQHNNYKNINLFFDVVAGMENADFDILCVGGEKIIDPKVLDNLPPGVGASRVILDDDDLAVAYSAAAALVYPSLYEGFGLPVVEAMSTGCPVITSTCGSLKEVAADAAEILTELTREEMARALKTVCLPERRARLIDNGLANAERFSWDKMAHEVKRSIQLAAEHGASGRSVARRQAWARLRQEQVAVDFPRLS